MGDIDHIICSADSSADSSPDSSHGQSQFLQEIPAEIRNKIYELVFPVNTIVYPAVKQISARVSTDLTVDPKFSSHEKVLALARTCRKIRDEVAALYFRSNLFSFDDGYRMYMFLHMIGETNRVTITKLEFMWAGNCPKQQMALLADCVNLKQLHIGICKSYMRGATSTIWEAHGLSTLRSIRGLPTLDLKVRQVLPDLAKEIRSTAFREIQPKNTKMRLKPRGTTNAYVFPRAMVKQLQCVLKEELGREKGPNAPKIRKLEFVTRTRETKILGAQVYLRPMFENSGIASVLPKRRRAAELGEEKRRKALKRDRI